MKPLSDFNKDSQKRDGVQSQCRECYRVAYVSNREKFCERNKRWYAANRYQRCEISRLRRIANPKLFNDRAKRWRVANPEKVKAIWRRQFAKDCSTPRGRTVRMMRTAVYRCLRHSGSKRGRRTFDLLGYTVEELMLSLESKFKTGMSWENYGEWHVDHKRPIASYDFSSADDPAFKECWSLENLQPLWAKENQSKGARYER